jgi:RimJ/RimL family protein N-acetyltransferase
MALKAVPYDPLHMEFMQVHPAFAGAFSREDPHALARSREAWSLIDDDGKVVAVIGAMETHTGVAYLWTFMSCDASKHLLTIYRFTRTWIDRLGFRRLECTVLSGFKAAHRWMRLLGFKRETSRPMKKWDGVDDFHLYSKIAR